MFILDSYTFPTSADFPPPQWFLLSLVGSWTAPNVITMNYSDGTDVVYGGEVVSADQFVEVPYKGGGHGRFGIFLRNDRVGDGSFYLLQIQLQDFPGHLWTVDRLDPDGTEVELAFGPLTSIAVDDVFRFEAFGDTIKAYQNGVVFYTYVDPTPLTTAGTFIVRLSAIFEPGFISIGGWTFGFQNPPVHAVATSTVLTSLPNPNSTGTPITLTATTTDCTGTPVLSGTVDFKQGVTVLQATVPVDNSGVATYTFVPPGGSHTYTAVYNGGIADTPPDTIRLGSVSNSVQNFSVDSAGNVFGFDDLNYEFVSKYDGCTKTLDYKVDTLALAPFAFNFLQPVQRSGDFLYMGTGASFAQQVVKIDKATGAWTGHAWGTGNFDSPATDPNTYRRGGCQLILEHSNGHKYYLDFEFFLGEIVIIDLNDESNGTSPSGNPILAYAYPATANTQVNTLYTGALVQDGDFVWATFIQNIAGDVRIHIARIDVTQPIDNGGSRGKRLTNVQRYSAIDVNANQPGSRYAAFDPVGRNLIIGTDFANTNFDGIIYRWNVDTHTLVDASFDQFYGYDQAFGDFNSMPGAWLTGVIDGFLYLMDYDSNGTSTIAIKVRMSDMVIESIPLESDFFTLPFNDGVDTTTILQLTYSPNEHGFYCTFEDFTTYFGGSPIYFFKLAGTTYNVNTSSPVVQVTASAASGTVPGFALLGTYSSQGDDSLPPSASLVGSPSPTTAGTAVFLLWSTVNVAKVRITGNNGVDPAFDTGMITTSGSGTYSVTGGFTTTIVLTLTGYDVNNVSVVTTHATVTIN